ncbi:MAG TPA: hypothetical protein P5120_00325 [Spirochaetota bacterium]|nr:hypothetical protein [Spirochaetota bacterium]HPF04472.1 hypothetical protein [Spirochaetota bacterium]HPJ40756.1 hypothetical protein [Spirochaetota bacterium]HPR36025.1 hypothetical protein [Spirochaetota bacterium]HRX45939.1 hypothetical protein [Spirochaetota bacterium]
MIRSVIISLLLFGGAAALTMNNIGYSGAGKEYHKKVRDERKSLRAGSGYYVPYHGGSGSFRTGK